MELGSLLFPEYRLNWFDAGPSSPNKTGALLAVLFVAAWWPGLRFRWGFWLSLPVAFVLLGLLLQTASRGALVGVACAGLLFAGFSLFARGVWRTWRGASIPAGSGWATGLPRRSGPIPAGSDWDRGLPRRGENISGDGLFSLGACSGSLAGFYLAQARKAWRYVASLRLWVSLGALAVLLFYSHELGVNERMSGAVSGADESANVRVALYSAGLQMVAAAPMGWGAGEAGNAYGQWYQTTGDSRSYLSLVNSHLTWMAEYGMVFQLLYIAGWCGVLLLCWPVPWTPLRAVALGTWIVLGVCGFFSSVLTLPWLWVVPGGLLLLCLGQRFRVGEWPGRRACLITSWLVLAGFVGLHAAAQSFSLGAEPKISASRERIEIGARPEALGLLGADRGILGDKYGHTVRAYVATMGGCTVLRSAPAPEHLSGFEALVLSGHWPDVDLSGYTGRLFWLNPPAEVAERTLQALAGHSLTVILGSLGDWQRTRVWNERVDAQAKWHRIELRGVADFVPDWPGVLMKEEL